MRVLHITDHYLPVLGGIEAHVSALARRQAAHGYDVTVLTSTPASADGRHHVDDGEVTVHRASGPLGLHFDFAPFDVVHAHVSVVAPFTAPVTAVAARSGTPTVVTVHSLWNGLGPVPGLAARVAGLRRAPVTWTAVSHVAARELQRRLPAGTPVGLLPNAVDVRPRPRPAPRRGARPVRLVTTMRVARRKRPLALLEIYHRLRGSVDVPTDLTIVGDGPLRPRVERLVTRAGLAGEVTVTGRLDPGAVLVELGRADIYVAPALLESFGLAALEARCIGLPVVGQATTGLTEFVTHGVDGLLGRDDADVGACLRLLVRDEDRRVEMSEHNRTTPSPLTWDNALARHDEVYARLRGRRPSRRTVAATVGPGWRS